METNHFLNWLVGTETLKHMMGEHDQKTHGRRMGVKAMVNHLFDLVEKSGGFTYRPRKGARTSGVSVSIPGYEQPITKKKFSRRKLEKYVRSVMPVIKTDRRNHLGAWWDKDTNLVILDVSRVFTKVDVATKHGITWKQKAGYNMSTGDLIYFGADEGRIAEAAAAGG